MATFNELNTYYYDLKKAFESKRESYYFNDDRSHNATVMRFMFDKSSDISMYCGELSVLRKGFYNKIEENAENIQESLLNSVNNFLNRKETKLNIILENYSKNLFDDFICKELFAKKMDEGQILLYRLNDDFSFKSDINHFCFTDSGIVRFEEDKSKHNAICVFHNREYIEMMKNNFGILRGIAIRVN